jgi:hypothetical protein
VQRRSWHPIRLDADEVAAIHAGRQTQVRKVIRAERIAGRDLADPLHRIAFLARCPYGEPGHTLWSRESAGQPESGARLWLHVERIAIQHLHDVTDADIRGAGVGAGFIPYEQLRRDYRERRARRHTRKGETWADNPWLWVVAFTIRPRA